MIQALITVHLIAFALALGGRIIFIPIIQSKLKQGINERLEELDDVLKLAKWSDYGFAVAIVTGILLFVMQGVPVLDTHWAFKLKMVTLLLLITDIGAFHVAQMRIMNHYDTQMIPAIKRLNSLAVLLMSFMVFFAISSP